MTFGNEDLEQQGNPYNDSLVISISIDGCDMRRS